MTSFESFEFGNSFKDRTEDDWQQATANVKGVETGVRYVRPIATASHPSTPRNSKKALICDAAVRATFLPVFRIGELRRIAKC